MSILSACTRMCTMCMPDAIDPVELELESCELPCGAGVEPKSSRGAASALNGVSVLARRKHRRYRLRCTIPPFQHQRNSFVYDTKNLSEYFDFRIISEIANIISNISKETSVYRNTERQQSLNGVKHFKLLLIKTFGRQRWADLQAFEARLVYTGCSTIARDM